MSGVKRRPATPPADADGAILFVGGVWVLAFVGAMALVGTYGSRYVPLADDWDGIVPYVTGRRPVTREWLWSQHNEHRVALPRLILLGVLKTTRGDFRAAMFLNVIVLAGVALGLIWAARKLRRRLNYVDAFFPLVLLNPAQYDNLLDAWQVQMVASTGLAGVLLCVIAGRKEPLTPVLAVLAGVCVVLLPLCGANGLALVPALALWLGYAGVRAWTSPVRQGRQVGLVLLAFGLAGLTLTGLYFVGYESPSYHPSSPGAWETLQAGLEILSSAAGVAPAAAWRPYLAAGLLSLVVVSLVALAEVWRTRAPERPRLVGLCLFLGAMACLVLGMGRGRAGFGEGAGIASRYVTLAAPTLCAVYFIAVLRGGAVGQLATVSLFLLFCAALGPTVTGACEAARTLCQRTGALEQDLLAGVPVFALAERHQGIFMPVPGAAERLALELPWLRRAGFGLYTSLRDDPPVPLVTKIDLTRPLPESLVLAGDWYEPNDTVRWTAGRAFLHFRLERVQRLRLHLWGNTFQEKYVRVILNTKDIDFKLLTGGPPELVEVVLAPEDLDEYNTLTLIVLEPTSPQSAGTGDDERILGLGVAWIEFVP